MRFIHILSLCLCLGLFAACSQSEEIIVDKQGQPALWKVTQKNNNEEKESISSNPSSLYLFGTVHLLPEGARWQSNAIEEAIGKSDILITETTGLEDTANVSRIFNSMATDEETITIKQRLEKENIPVLENIIDDKGLSETILSGMETWAASLAISNAITSDLGFKRGLGVETILKEKFDTADKPNEGLESIESQFAVFDNLSENEQRKMLESVILNSDKSKAGLLNLLDAWLAGDLIALQSETETGILEISNVREALLDGRNRNWVASLQEKLETSDNKSYFVAVGAAHLVGKNGVPALLEKAGYNIECVQ